MACAASRPEWPGWSAAQSGVFSRHPRSPGPRFPQSGYDVGSRLGIYTADTLFLRGHLLLGNSDDPPQRLEQEIGELSPAEIEKLRAWFAAYDAEQWDCDFERDADSGALDRQAENALADHRAGRTRPL